MKYKFRLVFYHSLPGFFHVDKDSETFSLADNMNIELHPRDSDSLMHAAKYHIDCGGFNSILEATNAGEKLRKHLRMLNCMLNLGLTIPINDGKSGGVSEGIKEKAREQGREILDTIVGLHVYPDDEIHSEYVGSAKAKVHSSDPLYALTALKETWPNTFDFDENTEDVLEILNISVREVSPKVKYLTAYLAIEQLIEREMRSESACKLIKEFIDTTNKSDMSEKERSSLTGSLGRLKEQSFSSAFKAFADRVKSPKTINGKSVKVFISECIEIRNKIAHKAELEDSIILDDEYAKHLRAMALSIIWSRYNLPNISVDRPADQITVEKFEARMM